jgi:hypothetical protein
LTAILAGVGYGGMRAPGTTSDWMGMAGMTAIVLGYDLFIAGLSAVCSAFAHSVRGALFAGAGIQIAATIGTIILPIGLSQVLPGWAVLALAASNPVLQVSTLGHLLAGHHSQIGWRLQGGVIAVEVGLGLAAIGVAGWRLGRPGSFRKDWGYLRDMFQTSHRLRTTPAAKPE